MHERIILDNRFSQIPHWVTFSDISDGALRLNLVLFKYASSENATAYPSRRTLTRDLRKSVKSVDNYTKELREIGALKVIKRKRKNSKANDTNSYCLITANPHAPDLPDVVEVDEGAKLVTPRTIPQPNYTHVPSFGGGEPRALSSLGPAVIHTRLHRSRSGMISHRSEGCRR
jgi:dynactin complex subunit